MTSSSVDHQMIARCLLRGIIPVPLRLSYTVRDPAVVRFRLGCLPRSWYVSRERLAQGLVGGPPDDDVECASRVHCSPLSDTRTFLALRNERDRWPMSLETAQLELFLRITYQLCPASHEQQLIEKELEAQLAMFATTQEGNS